MAAATSAHLTTRDAGGRIVVRQPFPAAGRVLGLLLMLPGIKLLWDWVRVFWEGGIWRWQPSDFLGMGFLLTIALVVLVPGWVATTLRRHVAIDHARREVVQVNDFLVYRWSKTHRLGDFDAICVIRPKRASRSRTVKTYNVELAGRGSSTVLLFVADDLDEARAVAKELAEVTGVPVSRRAGP